MNKEDLIGYADDLLKAAMYRLDGGDAEDLVQETMLAALLAIEQGKEIENPGPWLQGVLRRKYYDFLRQKYRRPTVSIDMLADGQYQEHLQWEDEQLRRLEQSQEAESLRRQEYLGGYAAEDAVPGSLRQGGGTDSVKFPRMEQVNVLLELDLLAREGGKLECLVPVITQENRDYLHKLGDEYGDLTGQKFHDELLALLQRPVKLPPHLKSVTEWYRYMQCDKCFTMMVAERAREAGLFLPGYNGSAPAVGLVVIQNT